MRKREILLYFIFVLTFIALFSSNVMAVIPPAPPVDIEFMNADASLIGRERILKISILPHEDIHADISCIVPDGVWLVLKPEFVVNQYLEDDLNNELTSTNSLITSQKKIISMSTGLLPVGYRKDFIFSIIFTKKGNYELKAIVDPLSKWGIKEKTLMVNIE